jgi:hypothetical protein
MAPGRLPEHGSARLVTVRCRRRTGGDRPNHPPGGPVGAGGSRSRRSSPSSCGATRPSMWPSPWPRAAGWWSWAGSSSGAGPLRMAAPARLWRWWPRSWGQACAGRRRRRPGPRAASSRLDRCDGAGRERSMAFRSVVLPSDPSGALVQRLAQRVPTPARGPRTDDRHCPQHRSGAQTGQELRPHR